MNRRSFFAALVNQPAPPAGRAPVAPPAPAPQKVVPAAEPASASGIAVRTGSHGERVSLLGYGAMRYPTVDGSHANTHRGGSNAPIDTEMVQRHVDYCIAHGVNYFDTSPVYCRGESEKVLGDALAKHPRDKWFVATKLSNFNAKTHSFEASREMYETSKRLLRTDHIDFYLLHSIGGGATPEEGVKLFNKRFIDNGILEFLLKERAAGRIRNLGFSFHGQEAVFRHALTLHDRVHWDFVQIQLNWVDWHHAKEVNKRNVNAETLYNLLDARGIPVVVMEPLLGGRLAKVKESVSRKLASLDPAATPAQWSFRFAGSFPRILTVLSGMTYLAHIEENVRTYSPLRPLDGRERDALERAARSFLSDDDIPCTGCNYCMPCPYGLDIPGLFNFWNQAVVEGRLPDDPDDPRYWTDRSRFLRDYAAEIPYLRQAQRCIGCRQCAPHCPQSIDIPAKIRKVDGLVEKLKRHGPGRVPAGIPCTSCGTCAAHCPRGLDISGIFGLWNRAQKEGWLPLDPRAPDFARNGRRFLRAYSRVTAGFRQAKRCIGCGLCAPHCPQFIDIPAQLLKVDGLVERLKRDRRV